MPKIVKFGRAFLTTAKWTLGVLSVLVLLAIAINWSDEDLSPEAKALLIAPPNPYKPEENLYLALLGFNAPLGESPIAAGQTTVAEYEKRVAAALKDPQYDVLRLLEQEGETLKFQGKINFCFPLTKSCLGRMEMHKAEIERLLEANRELFRRYSRLHGLKGYYETATPSPALLITSRTFSVQRLYLANIALRASSGKRSEQKAALVNLQDDIRTWRRVLTGSGSLVSKLAAITNLHLDYAVLADLIADRNFELESLSPEIVAMLDLSDERVWRIGSAFAFDYRIGGFLWDQMRVAGVQAWLPGWGLPGFAPETSDWWESSWARIESFFWKINATENLYARVTMQLQKMADAKPEEFFAARDAYRDWRRENVDFGPHYVYNPLGKSNAATEAPYEDYYLRAHDVAAFERLVRLGYEIRSQKILDEAVPSFIRQHPQWSSHPVDGRPFVWDDKKREVAVRPLQKQPKDRRFTIVLWNARPATIEGAR